MICQTCNKEFKCTREAFNDCHLKSTCCCNFCYIKEWIDGNLSYDSKPEEIMIKCEPDFDIKKAKVLCEMIGYE